MTFRIRQIESTAWAAALLGLLLLLAALQYRWLGQLGEAELSRLRTGTRARTAQLAQDFDREITRAFLWLRLDPVAAPERDGEAFAERYDRWRREAPHPRLVRDVYLVDGGPGHPARTFRFEPARRSFVAAPLPASLAGLHTPVAGATPADPRATAPMFELVREEGPALVHAVPTLLSGASGPFGMARVVVAHHLVVLLDREYLFGEFLPGLVHRHLPAGDGLEPHVEVASIKDPSRPLYRSGPEPQARAAHAGDASVTLLAVRIGETNRDLFVGTEPRKMFDRGWRAGTAAFGTRGPGGGGAVVTRAVGATFAAAAPLSGPEGLWRLVLRHRGGSLEDVVAAVRWRNVVVSSGILVVLAAGVIMTVIATQRAQRLARAEREFVAGVSHELSTPLSVICVAGENLADGLVAGDAAVRRYGGLVRDEGRRLRALVEQVLEFSAPLGTVARREPVDLGVVVAGALGACRPEIERYAFQVATDVAPDLPRVQGDPALLQGALQNLVGNALKYAGGSRWVAIRVEAPPGAGEVWITVRDGGIGIDPRDQGHIFEPFYRGRDARARQIRGSGLGLSLVRRTAEQHGGRVTVESRPGHGSMFTIRLPAEPQAAAARPSPALPEIPPRLHA